MAAGRRPLASNTVIDAANAFVLLLVSGISTVVLPYAKASVGQEIPATTRIRLFYALLPAVPDRPAWVWSLTGDAFNVFVFLEISSLSTYVLIAMGARKRQARLDCRL